ncbi:MAG: GDSL-type esterase/lipase family protein [Candidatus Sumerlaeia bacterium]
MNPYEQILSDLENLARAQPAVHGAGTHGFKLRPPLAEDDVVAFERDHSIRLPEDYRQFLIRCGAAGAGPGYGIFGFHELEEGMTWNETDGFVGVLAHPFQFTEAWNDHTGEPDPALQDEDPDEYDRQVEAFDKKYLVPLDGAIPISHMGCARYHWLVVTGPEAGHIWADFRAEGTGIRPVARPGSGSISFLEWYRDWLGKALAAAKDQGLLEKEPGEPAAPTPPRPRRGRRAVSPGRKALFVLMILAILVFVAGLAVEVALRAALAYKTRGNLNHVSPALNADPKRVLGMGEIILTDPNPLIVYRLKPGQRGLLQNAEISINSLGYRAPEPVKPTAGEEPVRVVLLGDSHTFGWGVEQNEIYAAQLGDALRAAAAPGKSIDVVNMGVPGYNSVQEVEAFLTRELSPRPAAVTIQYCLNDNILPLFLTRRNYLTDTRRLYLLDFAATVRRLTSPVAPDEGGLAQEMFHLYTPPRAPFELDPGQVPAEYLPLLGWDRLVEAYTRLKAACDKAAVPVRLVLPAETGWEHYKWGQGSPDRDPHCDKIVALCNRLGIPVIDSFRDVRDFVKAHGYQSSDLMIDDGHPNAMKHSIIAQDILAAIAPALEKEGALDAAKVPAELGAMRARNERRAAAHPKRPPIPRTNPLRD